MKKKNSYDPPIILTEELQEKSEIFISTPSGLPRVSHTTTTDKQIEELQKVRKKYRRINILSCTLTFLLVWAFIIASKNTNLLSKTIFIFLFCLFLFCISEITVRREINRRTFEILNHTLKQKEKERCGNEK